MKSIEHLNEAKKYVGEIKQKPLIKKPLSCKICHKFHNFEDKSYKYSFGYLLSDVFICLRCGAVFIQHDIPNDGIRPYDWKTEKHFMGYALPLVHGNNFRRKLFLFCLRV